MEKVCRFDLDWYFQYFIHTTHQIDYAIDRVAEGAETTTIECSRIGAMPMPQNITVTYTDGSATTYVAPLVMMPPTGPFDRRRGVVTEDWPMSCTRSSFDVPAEESPLSSAMPSSHSGSMWTGPTTAWSLAVSLYERNR